MKKVDLSQLKIENTVNPNGFDSSIYKKTSDLLSLKHLFDSNAENCNVIIRVKPEFKLDFIQIRSHIIDNLITAKILTKDLIKLEESEDVISYNVSKALPIIK